MVLGKYSTCASVIEEVCGGQEPYLAQATTIVTGSNTGIGKKAAQELAYLGGRVVLAVRNVDKGNAAVKEIVRDAPKALRDAGLEQNVVCMKMDLSSLASVDDFAKEFQRRSNDEAWPPLKCLVLNAGIFSTGSCKDTENGIEQVFGVNHLGHFYLTQLLLPSLRAAAPSRVVVVSSNGHRVKLDFDFADKQALLRYVVHPAQKDFGALSSYGYSKLCNVLFAQTLHELEKDNGVSACSLHPGDLIATDIGRGSIFVSFFMKYIYSWFTKSVDQGTSTTMYCSLIPDEQLEGGYFDNCARSAPRKRATGEEGRRAGENLWELSNELIQQAKL